MAAVDYLELAGYAVESHSEKAHSIQMSTFRMRTHSNRDSGKATRHPLKKLPFESIPLVLENIEWDTSEHPHDEHEESGFQPDGVDFYEKKYHFFLFLSREC